MVVVIDNGGANISSIIYALNRLSIDSELTKNKAKIKKASHVILPGVGSAAPAMRFLLQADLVEVIRRLTQPVLGICLGMQLLFERSGEGGVSCLGILPGDIKELAVAPECPVPHMGWNQCVNINARSKLLSGISDEYAFYFAHSFYAPLSDYTLAVCQYGRRFSAVVQKDNFYGCQFHPEKSSTCGQRLLRNFLEL
jgi:imidazole glycerol-phosphate synthase subunit HisH